MQALFFGAPGQSVDGYVRETSYGLASATGDVFGPFTLTGNYSSCSTSQMETDAIAAASAAGAAFQNYTRVFVVFPDTLSCGCSGLATGACSALTSPTGSFTASSSFLNTGANGTTSKATVQEATHA